VFVPSNPKLNPKPMSTKAFSALGGISQKQALAIANRNGGEWKVSGLSTSNNHQNQSYIFANKNVKVETATDGVGKAITTTYKSVSLTGEGITSWEEHLVPGARSHPSAATTTTPPPAAQ